MPQLITEPLGGSPLAAAALAGDARVAPWYTPRPADGVAWRARVSDVRRGAPADWLATLGPALDAHGAAAERLTRVAGGRGVVVTTGQQPGLFGGPIYTWSKALSALTLADALERATGVPVAPVFWAATDDADFDEAAWTAIAVPGGAEVLRLTTALHRPGTPMADTPLGDVHALLDALARGAGSALYREALAVTREAYTGERTIGGAYVALLRAVLEPLGMAVLDASHPASRAAMRPLLDAALARAPQVADAARERERDIRAAGFSPQVEEVPGLSLVFELGADGKRRIPVPEASAPPSTRPVLSPNVLLRPVAERAILPTVAYVAGPGELAYFAQVSAVARALGVAEPLAVPRWSVTIIEPHVARILDRYGLAVDELRQPSVAETRLARESLPVEARAALDAFRAALDARSGALRAASDTADGPLVPEAVIEGARRSMLHRLDRLERRYTAAMKRRQTRLVHDLGTARGALFPLGKRQERALNLVPLLARHGPALLDGMRAEAARHAEALVGAREHAGARASRTGEGLRA